MDDSINNTPYTQQAGGGNPAQPAGHSFSVVWSPQLLCTGAVEHRRLS